ncbi:MAG: extracellular solute-binding protein [Eubacteriales bacterium]|nr:extracellular solute-binding protein [Eubacteriales bacterium]
MTGKKRTLIILSIILALVVALAGCQGGTGTTKATGSTTSSGEPMKMLVRMFYHGEIDKTMAQGGIDFNDNKFANFHRENSGVDVTFEPALADGASEAQKKAMILASNDTPDLMDMNRTEYYKYASQGVLTDVEPYLAQMPDYSTLVNSYGDNLIEYVRFNGKVYAFPSVLEESDLNRTHAGGIGVRKDVMDDLGIAVPKTITDYYNMWKTVKEKTELIPLTSAGDGFSAIKAAYRVALNYKEVGDKLEYIWVQPEFKDYLTFMNKLYNEGLLDQEFITTTGTTLTEKFMGDKAYSLNTGWATLCVSLRDIGTKIDGAEMAFMPQPTGPNGEKALLFHNWPVQRLWVIPEAAKNKEAAVKFFNYMSTKESKMVQDYGILNDDYTLDAAGKPVQTLEQQMNVTWKICYEVMATPDSFKVRLVAKGYDWAYTQAQEAEKDADFTRNLLAILPVDEEFLKVEQKLALSTFISEETIKFITGVRPMADFDKFVSELKAKGLDEQTEALNTWYTKYKD